MSLLLRGLFKLHTIEGIESIDLQRVGQLLDWRGFNKITLSYSKAEADVV